MAHSSSRSPPPPAWEKPSSPSQQESPFTASSHRRTQRRPTAAAINLFTSFNQPRWPVNYLPSPQQLQQSRTTAATRSSIDRKKRTRRKREQRSLNRSKKTKIYCLGVFSFVTGNGDPHRRQGREEEKKLSQTHPFPRFSRRRVLPLFRLSLRLHRILPCNSWSFRGCFVIVKVFNVIFV
jgi:hypothetical protein